MFLPIFFLYWLLFSASAAAQDFCVANYSAPTSPAGYSCKDPAQVIVTDFVFNLGTPGIILDIFGTNVSVANPATFPGLNGLGLALARLDFALGGVIPMHTHPRGSELILVIKGTLLSGFIDSTDKVYIKYLNEGDIMVFPQGLLHFQINTGPSRALAFVSLSSANPGFQIIDTALFASSLPSDIIQQTVLLDYAQVKKLKDLFGGSG